ncbi:IPT/TIG domain-containing protein [Paenibacillus assamensis]|uniref:IPT/TIG domain-containing protein n=1 Tax=Paenibacillus assamensis TaxID=311244 RepID=UPI001FE1CC55|nr:IPT/TIG domain-containing protein [Paenibacillus assamensis]
MKHIFTLVLTFIVLFVQIPLSTVQASTNYVSASRSVNPNSIIVGQEAEVKLSIQGTPPVNVVKPNDVILVIDKSGSMSPGANNGEDKMKNALDAAKGFIDLMDLSKHRVGVVDFSSAATSFPLTSDAVAAKNYIDTIIANGSTATGASIDKAIAELTNHRPDAQPVIVLMTDGAATVGGDGLDPYKYALKKAEDAKNAGIVFYTIALLSKNDDPNNSAPNKLMMDMATTSHHHHFVLGSTGLAEIYSAIVKEIGLASAYDVTVTEVVNDAFEIVPGSYEHNIPKPVVNGNTLTWKFLELKNDKLDFTYKIRHKADRGAGKVQVTTADSKITYKDYTGANRIYSPPATTLEVKYPAPIIMSVTPAKSHIAGGEKIKIVGEHFRPNLNVPVGGGFATNVTFINDKEIEAVVPVGKQGETTLKVVNDDNQEATAPFAYFADPEVSSISPSSGPLAGGTQITIAGKNFMPGVKIKVGENYSPSVTYHTSIYMQAVTPAGQQPGLVNVTVENPDGTQVLVTDAFRYEEPPKMELKSITPAEGVTTGNETITLNGQLFDRNAKVFFGTVEAPKLTYFSSNKLTVETPVWPTVDIVDVKVQNPDGTVSVLEKGFKYILPPPPPAPKVSGISPKNGPLEGGTTVYIDGSNFVKGAKVLWGEQIELEADFINSNRLSVLSPKWSVSEGVSLKVTNPDTQSGLAPETFTYDKPLEFEAPKVRAVSPKNGPIIGGTTIYVDGSGIRSGAKMYMIHNGQEIDLNATFVNATRMYATTPAVTSHGPVTIKIVNPDTKFGELPNGFTYDKPPEILPPTIKSITPNSGNKRGGGLIDIVGTDFQKGAKVTFGTQTVDLAAFLGTTSVRVYVPASPTAGSVDVTLTNPDGNQVKVANGYTYEEAKPEITRITPNKGPMAGGTTVYVDGRYLESGLVVTMNNQTIPYTLVNSTRIFFNTPASTTPGEITITVTNPSGNSTSTVFTYEAPPEVPAPQLRSVSPSSGPVAGGTTIYIDGSNFVKGIKIIFNGIEYKAEYVNSRRIYFTVPSATAPGIVSFTVVNPDGKQSSSSLNFEYK